MSGHDNFHTPPASGTLARFFYGSKCQCQIEFFWAWHFRAFHPYLSVTTRKSSATAAVTLLRLPPARAPARHLCRSLCLSFDGPDLIG